MTTFSDSLIVSSAEYKSRGGGLIHLGNSLVSHEIKTQKLIATKTGESNEMR